jgi:hypothetical protein
MFLIHTRINATKINNQALKVLAMYLHGDQLG